MAGGLFGPQLAQLDIPTDGSAKLVSINTEDLEDGSRVWTVKFKSQPVAHGCGSTSNPAPSAHMGSMGSRAPPSIPSSPTRKPASSALPPILIAGHSSEELDSPVEGLGSPLSQRPFMDRLLALKCQVKTYAWGKTGTDSLVAELAAEGMDELEVNEGTPYAELWMGTHPSGPSMIMLTSPWKMVTPLSEWIKVRHSRSASNICCTHGSFARIP